MFRRKLQSAYVYKGKIYSLNINEQKFDSIGRTVSSTNYSKGNYPYTTHYQYKNNTGITTVSRHGKTNSFHQKIYNEHGKIITDYYVRKKNGKVKSQYYYTYTYTSNHKIIAQFHASKNDTSIKYPFYKYYYQNDTGQKIKVEHYNKNKIILTQMYDCDIQKPNTLGKDSSKICVSKGTDDRGYTFITNFTYSGKHKYKNVSIINPDGNLVSYVNYFVNDKMQELETFSWTINTDSSTEKNFYYNRKYTKLKSTSIQTKYYSKDKKITLQKQSHIRKGKVSQHVSYFKYYENGLTKSTVTEFINKKGKLTEIRKEHLYYTPFNF